MSATQSGTLAEQTFSGVLHSVECPTTSERYLDTAQFAKHLRSSSLFAICVVYFIASKFATGHPSRAFEALLHLSGGLSWASHQVSRCGQVGYNSNPTLFYNGLFRKE